ncbi:hypothetical protein EYF80_051929 [Liparis tanakae]|uniref:Uncharacterized protein n=1 Tax=Liparis tanakae TaxID=230148 RepID=A0A4Z2FBZ4_9TELE|nr:hypothetical protein EYF80_051929 [Liparis tanakae]
MKRSSASRAEDKGQWRAACLSARRARRAPSPAHHGQVQDHGGGMSDAEIRGERGQTKQEHREGECAGRSPAEQEGDCVPNTKGLGGGGGGGLSSVSRLAAGHRLPSPLPVCVLFLVTEASHSNATMMVIPLCLSERCQRAGLILAAQMMEFGEEAGTV